MFSKIHVFGLARVPLSSVLSQIISAPVVRILIFILSFLNGVCFFFQLLFHNNRNDLKTREN